jgi:hypothetical protein
MADSPPTGSGDPPDLAALMESLGRELGQREAAHREALARARERAEALRAEVAAALERFHAAVEAAGAPQLRIELGEIRVDDKHLRAVEFDLRRGCHRGIVTAKSRGDVTLVGPFQAGKVEGPCLSFPFDAEAELRRALGDFLGRFVEEAATP